METPDLPPIDSGRPFFSPFRTRLRRVLFFSSVVIVNLIASLWLLDLLWRMGLQKAHFPLLAVFFVLNGLLVLGSFHAIFGALDMLFSRKRAVRITRLAAGKTGPLAKRHAVAMPVYNEDSVKVCARIEAIYRSIKATGHLDSFDFFILSDTRDLDLWVQEEISWTNLCRRLGGFGRIYYRRRKANENRKAGNIGDFVRTWGGGYEAMLVLEAHSLVNGADIVKMTRIMAYLGSPLWFLFLLLGTWVAWDRFSSSLSQLPFESYVDRWFGINGVEQSLILTGFVLLLLSAPVSVWTSRARYSKTLARHKILSTPEELNPPTVIRMADEAGAAIDPALDASAPARCGIVAAVVDPYVNGVNVSLLEHSELSHVEEALAERCLALGPSGLSKNELTELLYLAPAMLMMHRAAWLRSVEGIHSVWTQAVESYRRRLEHSPLQEIN